jgi:hypothetical protein
MSVNIDRTDKKNNRLAYYAVVLLDYLPVVASGKFYRLPGFGGFVDAAYQLNGAASFASR